MTATLEAIFDGAVLRPEEPLALAANTRVRITLETLPPATATDTPPRSFLQTARALRLDGPPDWSEKLDDYLHGDKAAS